MMIVCQVGELVNGVLVGHDCIEQSLTASDILQYISTGFTAGAVLYGAVFGVRVLLKSIKTF